MFKAFSINAHIHTLDEFCDIFQLDHLGRMHFGILIIFNVSLFKSDCTFSLINSSFYPD